jgi:hypothetical protein
MDDLLKLLIGNVSRFIPSPQFLEVIERNKRGKNLIGDPVVLNNVIEWIQIDVFHALVERFRNRLHDHDVVKRIRISLGNLFTRDVQKFVVPGTSFPLLNDLQRPFILPGVDFQTQNGFRVVAWLSEIVFVDG